jgi:anionic cell wall polymer biosynthesis LytR-Cps2A-Psr (LCP) family protein
VLIIGTVVVVASGLTVVVPTLVARWAVGEVDQVNVIPHGMRGNDISGAINLLLIGIDERQEGPDSDELARADSMVLVHIPADHSQVFMISLPRDLRVKIPAFEPTGYRGATYKINSAFANGAKDRDGRRDTSATGRGLGAVLTMQTIDEIVRCGEWRREPVGGGWDGQRCTKPGVGAGLEWHGSAVINFDGFDDIVEALGSVYMCIDEDVYSIHYWADGSPADGYLYAEAERTGRNPNGGYHYVKGECRDMQPWEALDYSRQRIGVEGGDYGRHRHQQQLLKAIVAKVASTDTLTNLTTIQNLQQAAGGALSLDLGGFPILDWAWTLRNLRADDITMVSTYAGQAEGASIDGEWFEPVLPSLVELLQHVRDDTVLDFLTAHEDWVATDATPTTD